MVMEVALRVNLFRESMVQVVCILSRMRCLDCILSLLDWSPLMVDGQSSQICEWMTLLLRWERPLLMLYGHAHQIGQWVALLELA